MLGLRKVHGAGLYPANGQVNIGKRLTRGALPRAVCIAFLLALALSASASRPLIRTGQTHAATPALAPGLGQEFQTVAPGIEHMQIVRGRKSDSDATGPWSINLLRIDFTKAKLRWVHALDEAVGLETVSSMAARYNAIAAVNSGYFRTTGTYRGDSIGVGVLNGKLISEPYNNRASMGLIETPGKMQVVFGHLKFSASLAVAGSARHVVDGFNRPRAENELIIFTPEFHRTTLTNPDGVELIVRRGRVVERHDRRGSSVIPADGFVISAGGTARKWAMDNLPTGSWLKLNSTLTPLDREQSQLWKQATSIIGGGPQLIKDGRVQITTAAEKMLPNFATDRHPRTAVARLHDGRVLFVTVDGRQAGVSVGMSLTELASLLLEFGADEAINLDGGGSTTMVVKSRTVNKPSDTGGERPVSDALLVFSR
jgi:exopolysaccharide biosynthesis protein